MAVSNEDTCTRIHALDLAQWNEFVSSHVHCAHVCVCVVCVCVWCVCGVCVWCVCDVCVEGCSVFIQMCV